MIKRVSLVWKRPDLTDAEFKRLWLGEHAELAKRLVGLREYVIDFVEGEKQEDGRTPSAIATLRFDTRAALDAAFSDDRLRCGLIETRDQFAGRVEILFVDENIIVDQGARA